jgi:hypothetical protein
VDGGAGGSERCSLPTSAVIIPIGNDEKDELQGCQDMMRDVPYSHTASEAGHERKGTRIWQPKTTSRLCYVYGFIDTRG